jgi:MFS family permease
MNTPADAPPSILRHRPFLLYWNARIFGAVAFQMLGVAVGWQMYQLTGSAFDLGLVGLFQFLPAAVLMLVAGEIADRYDRRRILQICLVGEGVAAAALAFGSITGWIGKEYMLAAVFLLGAGRAFEATTMQTLLPAVVPPALFPRAVAGASSATQAATITGPAIGGFLYAFGPTVVYVICFLLFVCGASLLAFVHVTRSTAARPPLTREVFFSGVSFIRRTPVVLGVISLDLFAVFLGSVVALLPIFAKDVFDAGPAGLGLLRAAPAVGALAAVIVLSRWTLTRNVGHTMFAMVACFGFATVVFGMSTSFVLSLIALAVLGTADAVGVVIRQTLLQLETPDDMRGRVSAVNALFVTASNQLGDFRAGAMAAFIGAVPAVLVGGVCALLVTLTWIKLFPELYRVQSFRTAMR